MPAIITAHGRQIRVRDYSPSGEVGRQLQRAADLQSQIQLLDNQLRIIRTDLLSHMEAQALDRIECGDFRATRKVRHNWKYSPETEREMLRLKQSQKWEQVQGLATDRPTVTCAFTLKSAQGEA